MINAGDAAASNEPVSVKAVLQAQVPEDVLKAFGNDVIVEAVFSLQSPEKTFGGLSGLWIAPDGSQMIAVSDIGQRWQAELHHDDTGRLIDLDGWSVADLTPRPEDEEGRGWNDAESLADLGAEGLVVAYEGQHRLRRWRFDDLNAVPESVVLPKGLGGPSNSGLEALSALGDHRLFAVAEHVGAWGGEGLMGWLIDGKVAEDLVYIPGPGFAPTGADQLDDEIYVVERSFSLFGGFRSRIVTVPIDAIRPGARIEGRELTAFRWGDIGENFEGIVAKKGPDDRILLYLLADDNFSFFQNTLLVQLSLPPKGVAD